jgi:hypothetical protein
MSYASIILDEQNYGGLPVAYWPLDEASGIVAADALGNNNGTLSPNSSGAWSGGTLNNQPGPIAREGGSPMFNGSTGYLNCGRLGNLGSNLGDGLTLEAWMRTSSSTSWRTIFGWSISGTDETIYLIANINPAGGLTNPHFSPARSVATGGERTGRPMGGEQD